MPNIFDQLVAQQPQSGSPAPPPTTPQPGGGNIFQQLAAKNQGQQQTTPPATAATPPSTPGVFGSMIDQLEQSGVPGIISPGAAQATVGAGKSALDAFQHIGSTIVNPVAKVLGKATGGKIGDASVSANPITNLSTPTLPQFQTNGIAEKVGGFGEGVGEFIAGGELLDGVLAGVKGIRYVQAFREAEAAGQAAAWIKRFPLLSRALGLTGRVAEQAVIGGGQAAVHGNDVASGAEGGAVGGVVGEGLGAVVGKVLGKGAAQVADDVAAKVDSAPTSASPETPLSAEDQRVADYIKSSKGQVGDQGVGQRGAAASPASAEAPRGPDPDPNFRGTAPSAQSPAVDTTRPINPGPRYADPDPAYSEQSGRREGDTPASAPLTRRPPPARVGETLVPRVLDDPNAPQGWYKDGGSYGDGHSVNVEGVEYLRPGSQPNVGVHPDDAARLKADLGYSDADISKMTTMDGVRALEHGTTPPRVIEDATYVDAPNADPTAGPGATPPGAAPSAPSTHNVPANPDAPAAKAGDQFGVPLSYGQRTGNKTVLAYESFIKQVPFLGKGEAAQLAARQATAIRDAGTKIADDLGRSFGNGPSEQASVVSQALQDTKASLTAAYNGAMGNISAKVGDKVQIPLDGTLRTTAQKLIDQMTLPASVSAGVEDSAGRNRVLSFLKQFTDTSSHLPSELEAQGITKPGSTLTFDQARVLKQQINEWAFSGDTTVGKGALKQMGQALDTSIQDGLGEFDKASGNGSSIGQADIYRQQNGTYSQMKTALQNGLVKGLMKGKLNSVGPLLLNPASGLDRVEALDMILQHQGSTGAGMSGMEQVRRSVWDTIWQRSMDKTTGVFDGQKFASQLNGMDGFLRDRIFMPGASVETAEGATSGDPGAMLRRMGEFTQLVAKVTAPLSKDATGSYTALKGVAGLGTAGELFGVFHASPVGLAIMVPGMGAIKITSRMLFDSPEMFPMLNRLMESQLSAFSKWPPAKATAMWTAANRPLLARLSAAANAQRDKTPGGDR